MDHDSGKTNKNSSPRTVTALRCLRLKIILMTAYYAVTTAASFENIYEILDFCWSEQATKYT